MSQNKSLSDSPKETVLKQSEQKETVDCYACMDKLWHPMQGPMCILCVSPRGNGWGGLYKEYRNQVVTVTNKDDKTVVFDPPSYSCVLCKDTKKSKYWIDDPNILPGLPMPMDGCPTVGDEATTLSCHRCMKEQHKIDYKKVQQTYVK